jgi:hypothetical protein
MNRHIAVLTVASLAVVFATQPVAVADDQRGVEILVGGAPQRHYAHGGRWYVEALKGREYAIRLHNPYAVRVAVALSVDGLNTIDARQTTAADARKWVLDPYQTITISGWQTSQTEARRFEFTTEARSYGQSLGATANLGVISAAFFKERVRSVVPEASKDAAELPAAALRARPEAPAAEEKRADEYAATGMGRRTGHTVTQVWLDLEKAPVRTTNIRYEFRAQLVSLGILPPAPTADALQRRERAHGFAQAFCPEPPSRH